MGITLGKIQIRIMRVLWERRKASAREITDALEPETHLAHSTIQTLLRKMEIKGVITHDVRDRTFVFRPLVNAKRVTRTATDDFLERVFDGSVKSLMAHLVAEDRISPDELKELRDLVDRKDANRGKKR